jgi:cell division septum initiation protein DivIVA
VSKSEHAAPAADPRELERAGERIAELERALEQARADRVEAAVEPAVSPAASAPVEQPEDAGELLVSALRTADALRAAVREEAQRTLKKAHERAAKLERQAEHQRRALEQARARAATLTADADRVGRELEAARAERDQAERDAERVRERVRVEAEQTLGALQLQRQRVQSLLGDALAALDENTGEAPDVLDDLAARLHPQAPDPA